MHILRALIAAGLWCAAAVALGQGDTPLASRAERVASADAGSAALSNREGMLSVAERARLFQVPTHLAHKSEGKKAPPHVRQAPKAHRTRRAA
jgi:hypothetical protein